MPLYFIPASLQLHITIPPQKLSLHHILKLHYMLPAYEVHVPYKLPQYPQGGPFLITGCLWAQMQTQYHIANDALSCTEILLFPPPLFPPLPHNTNKHTQDSKSNDSNIPDASVGKIVDQTLVCASIR